MTKPSERLASILKKRGITAYRLSQVSTLPQSHISDLLKRDRRITARTALFLGAALQMDPKELMAWQSEWDLHLLRGEE